MSRLLTSAVPEPVERLSLAAHLRRLWRRNRAFLIVVALPTALVAAYLYGIAADQYRSQAHYLVRAGATPPTPSVTLGQSLGLGALGGGQSEAMSVSDYLTSHDVVEAVSRKLNLVEIFNRPEADVFSRLGRTDPTPEELLRYYRKKVEVRYDAETGITMLTVNAFRASDSYALSSALLALGEQRVNEMNRRSFGDAVAQSQRQLAEAEGALTKVQTALTSFRQTQRDVNPTTSAEANLRLLTDMQGKLAEARAQLANTQALIGGNNPQSVALRQRVASLTAEIGRQSGTLTGGSGAIAADLGDFERLRMQQEFLAKRYDAANASYELSRQQAVRQQLYIVRVVNPNLPVKPLYPKRLTILATTFAILVLVFAIGWLIHAGMREHAR